MYELRQIGDVSYYLESPVKVGLYLKNGKDAFLIDSGNSKEAGRKILKLLKEQGWQLRGILNTHSHADHIGGNQYLQKQTDCSIFAGGAERAFTEQPVLTPAFFYGGYPGSVLRHKPLLAAPSVVRGFADLDFPKEIEIIPLPGHSFEQVGFGLPDGTVFMADCVSSEATLMKYQIGVIYDVAAYLHTLEAVCERQAAIFVPSHTETVTDMRPLAELNRNKVLEIAEHIVCICREQKCLDQILKELFQIYSLQMSMEQYVLVGNTLRSYLSWLTDNGKLENIISDCMVYFKAL